MSDLGGMSPLNQLLRATALELNACQKQVHQSVQDEAVSELAADQQALMLSHLLDTLAQTESSLNQVIEAGRFEKIDPMVLSEVQTALHDAITDPLDAKVKSVYVSIFGYNTSLWHMMRNIQKLLRTVHIPDKEIPGKRVMKVEKTNKDLKKNRDK